MLMYVISKVFEEKVEYTKSTGGLLWGDKPTRLETFTQIAITEYKSIHMSYLMNSVHSLTMLRVDWYVVLK